MTKTTGARTTSVKSALKTFEQALRKAESHDGTVDIAALKSEVRKSKPGKEAKAIFDECIAMLESKYGKYRTVSAGCGGTARERVAAKSLTSTQAQGVLAALVEARTKGIDKIDRDGDGEITPAEAKRKAGASAGDKIAKKASRAAVAAHRVAPRPRKPVENHSGEGRPVSVGC